MAELDGTKDEQRIRLEGAQSGKLKHKWGRKIETSRRAQVHPERLKTNEYFQRCGKTFPVLLRLYLK